jgi:two-component system, NtrC family, sensor kinase
VLVVAQYVTFSSLHIFVEGSMKITKTIGFRLFLLIASVQAAILAALTYATVSVQQSHLMDSVIHNATQISDLIARSTRYSMLLNRKEDVHNIIASVGGEPGIAGIRIYNKQGQVIFATVQEDVHSTVDMDAEACVICHSPAGLEAPHLTGGDLHRIFSKPTGGRVLGLITPIRNEQSCSDSECHAHPAEKTILGVLDVKMELASIDRQSSGSRNQLLILSVSGWFIWTVVRTPVRRLTTGMQMVASGQLDQRLEEGTNELGLLAGTFNRMTVELARARADLTAWSDTLERKVREKTADLEKAHSHMVTVEKLASLGNLAATVAHELNNPLEGILTFAKLMRKRIQRMDLPAETKQEFVEELTLVADEATRSGNIVKNLLIFARQTGGEFQITTLKMIVDRCVLLMKHHAEMHHVQLDVSCPGNLTAECDPNKIQQALVALMVNGIEAMASRGGLEENRLTVKLGSGTESSSVILMVSDQGIGMDQEVKDHIFEPFFTTKSEMKGVGLGLAVVYGIVELHHGTIAVDSSPGLGTTFTIQIPQRQPEGVLSSSRTSQGVSRHE